MSILKRFPLISTLFGANALALAFVLTAAPASAGGDFCPNGAEGCKCIEDVPLNPDGCHEQYAPEFECHGAAWCGED